MPTQSTLVLPHNYPSCVAGKRVPLSPLSLSPSCSHPPQRRNLLHKVWRTSSPIFIPPLANVSPALHPDKVGHQDRLQLAPLRQERRAPPQLQDLRPVRAGKPPRVVRSAPLTPRLAALLPRPGEDHRVQVGRAPSASSCAVLCWLYAVC